MRTIPSPDQPQDLGITSMTLGERLEAGHTHIKTNSAEAQAWARGEEGGHRVSDTAYGHPILRSDKPNDIVVYGIVLMEATHPFGDNGGKRRGLRWDYWADRRGPYEP